jgi:DNA primase
MSKQQNHMVDFRKVKDSVSITRILEHYDVLGEFSKRGDRLEGPCPIHDGDNRSFSITSAKNTWYCFGKCKQGGNILDLVAKMEKCGVRDAAIKISNWFDLDNVEHKPGKQKEPKPDRPPKKSAKSANKKRRKSGKDELCVEDEADHKRPDANQPLTFELKALEPDHEALLTRNLISDTAAHFGAGYCKRGLLKGRIAVPVHSLNGELLAYAGAATKEAREPAYLWPKNFNPALELFNLHRVIGFENAKPPLLVVCDIFDIFELFEAGREHAVALMGKTVSKAQLTLLSDYLSKSDVAAIHFMVRPGTPKLRKTVCALAEIAFVRFTLSDSLGTMSEPQQKNLEPA